MAQPPIRDQYSLSSELPSGSAQKFFAITPHDTNQLPEVVRGIYVGVAGNVVVKGRDGTSVTFKGATAGSVLPVSAHQVMNTDTTATDLVGLV